MDYILWAGSPETYEAYVNLQKFLVDPTYFAESKLKTFAFSDDDDDETVSYGIGSHLVKVEDGIATVSIRGSLVNSYSSWNRYFGVVSYAEIRSAVEQVLDDDTAKKVVMNYETGGGQVSGIDETAQYLIQAGKVKPFISYTSTAALSGGYWLAATASKFYASKTAQVGSIGVIQVQISRNRAMEEYGYDINIIRAGKNKAVGHPLEPLTDAGRAKLQAQADTIYDFFTAHVAQQRGISQKSATTWAEGNVFYAEEARSHNLVDGVTYYNYLVSTLRNSLQNSLVSDLEPNMDVDDMSKKQQVASEADLAKLQSGATQDVTTVETPEEEVPATVETPDVDASVEAPETPETPESKVEAPTEPEPSVSAQMLSETQDKLLAVSTKLAMANQSLQELQTKFDAAAATTVTLIEAVSVATNRMQIGLNQSPMNLTGLPAETVIAQWETTNADFSNTFKIGAQAAVVKQVGDVVEQPLQTAIRPIEE